MSALPLLPGYVFHQYPERPNFGRKQMLEWRKGVPVPKTPWVPAEEEVFEEELRRNELYLQFGQRRHARERKFLPKWAVLEKKAGNHSLRGCKDPRCGIVQEERVPMELFVDLDAEIGEERVLQFRGYSPEVFEEPNKVHRIRPIVLLYHLLDDTISIFGVKSKALESEKTTLLKRQAVPRSGVRRGEGIAFGEHSHEEQMFFHWSQLNRGQAIEVYGKKYVLCDCDDFTKDFLLSEGIELNPPIQIPPDPYETLRQERRETPHRSITLRSATSRKLPNTPKDGLVLKFDIIVEEQEEGGRRPRATAAILSYRLEDGKVEIRKPVTYEDTEIRQFSPVVLRWSKVPLVEEFRSSPADIGEEEETSQRFETLCPSHLIPPAKVNIFGKRVLVTGCDQTTSQYLKEVYGAEELPQMAKPAKHDVSQVDSSKSVGLNTNTQRPIRPGIMNNEDSKVLRFSARLRSSAKEDEGRSFVVTFYTIDSTFEVYEQNLPGGLGGRVLSRIQIPKPELQQGSGQEMAYYTLKDIYIGAVMNIWGRLFEFVGADRFVLNYAQENPEKVSPQLLRSLQDLFEGDSEKEPASTC